MDRFVLRFLVLVVAVFSYQVFAAPGGSGGGKDKGPSSGSITGSFEYCGYNAPAKVFTDKHSFYAETSDGSFVLHNVPAGTYDLVVTFPAYLHFPSYRHSEVITLDSELLDLGSVWIQDPVYGCPLDSDGDGIIDDEDPCPSDANPQCGLPLPITDTITANGKVWAQVDLFQYLSWNEILAVCPDGTCAGGGVLNGYDMTGWTWASRPDVISLFNTYGADLNPTASSPLRSDYNSSYAPAFYGDGWRPLEMGPAHNPYRSLMGWLADQPDWFCDSAPFEAQVSDSPGYQFDTHDSIGVNCQGGWTADSSASFWGAFFYQTP